MPTALFIHEASYSLEEHQINTVILKSRALLDRIEFLLKFLNRRLCMSQRKDIREVALNVVVLLKFARVFKDVKFWSPRSPFSFFYAGPVHITGINIVVDISYIENGPNALLLDSPCESILKFRFIVISFFCATCISRSAVGCGAWTWPMHIPGREINCSKYN